MNYEPTHEDAPTPDYFRNMDAPSVSGWMWALDYNDDDRIIAEAYCIERTKDKPFAAIAVDMQIPEEALHDILGAFDRRITEAQADNQRLKQQTEKRGESEAVEPRRHPVIETAAVSKEFHPVLQAKIAGQAIHACYEARPSDRDKFFSDKTKDQESAVNRFCAHCVLKDECRAMAAERPYKKAVYGGLTRLGLEAEIWRRKNTGPKNGETKKKKKKK